MLATLVLTASFAPAENPEHLEALLAVITSLARPTLPAAEGIREEPRSPSTSG